MQSSTIQTFVGDDTDSSSPVLFGDDMLESLLSTQENPLSDDITSPPHYYYYDTHSHATATHLIDTEHDTATSDPNNITTSNLQSLWSEIGTADHQEASNQQDDMCDDIFDWLVDEFPEPPPEGYIYDSQIDAYHPPRACVYCRQNRFQCVIIRTTKANPNPRMSCSTCVGLFRQCSHTEGGKRRASRFETVQPVVGHLHGISEEAALEAFDARNTNQGQSAQYGVQLDSSYWEPVGLSGSYRGDKRSSSRLTRRTKPLRQWFSAHQDNPYPTEQDRLTLTEHSGLSKTQIQNWFANARRRQRQSNQAATKSSLFPQGSPMPQSMFANMTPLERWRHSPPDDDAISASIIDEILNADPIPESLIDFQSDTGYLSWQNEDEALSAGFVSAAGSDALDFYPSSTSVSSHATSDSSISNSSRVSIRSRSRTSRSTMCRSTRKHRSPQPFECTFCPITFKRKFDWSRHEKSIHLSLDSWVCQPRDSTVWAIGEREPRCSYCGSVSPTKEHIDTHDFSSCMDRPTAERTFGRKDHLWQHLQKFHSCQSWTGWDLGSWRGYSDAVMSRCGFCDASLGSWSDREEHLAKHFSDGCRMNQWIGDWGFDLPTARLLRRAILPVERKRTG